MIKRLTFLFVLACTSLQASTTVTLLHFSDYHSHALPFYTEEGERGGIARAIGFMDRHKKAGALVFNGGDMMNRGAPAWSDKYECAEWPWLNGIVDAMAFGNHDADYGNDELGRCRASARYPILSANTTGFERWLVYERGGVRIGVFAISGSDFPRLVTNAKLTFSDPVVAARDVVAVLREHEHADAVVMIGHEDADADYRLAAAVPGIDLILGTHAHVKRPMTTIPGTNTRYISAYQYLEYISVVDLVFDDHRLKEIEGRLVPVDASMEPDPEVDARVRKMEAALEADPQYRPLFVPVARAPKPMSLDELGLFAVETMRDAAGADVAISTKNSFRQPLPGGALTLETLRAALPYNSEVFVAQVTRDQLQKLLARTAVDPAYATGLPAGMQEKETYRVAVTDYMVNISAAYRDVLAGAKLSSAGIRARDAVIRRLSSMWPGTP